MTVPLTATLPDPAARPTVPVVFSGAPTVTDEPDPDTVANGATPPTAPLKASTPAAAAVRPNPPLTVEPNVIAPPVEFRVVAPTRVTGPLNVSAPAVAVNLPPTARPAPTFEVRLFIETTAPPCSSRVTGRSTVTASGYEPS